MARRAFCDVCEEEIIWIGGIDCFEKNEEIYSGHFSGEEIEVFFCDKCTKTIEKFVDKFIEETARVKRAK